MALAYKAGNFQGHPKYRWVKMYDGQRHRITCEALGLPRDLWTKEGSRQAANEWWERELAKLTSDPVADAFKRVTSVPLEQLQHEVARGQVAAKILKAGKEPTRENIERLAGTGKLSQEDVEEVVAGLPANVANQFRQLNDRPITDDKLLNRLNKLAGATTAKTIQNAIDQFVEHEKREVKPVTWQEVKDGMRNLPFAGSPIATLNEATIDAFISHLDKSGLAPITKKKKAVIFKRFVMFAYKRRMIELPRNLDELGGWDVRAKKVKTYDLVEVRKVLGALPVRLKAWAMLGLNCGMTQADLSAMSPDMVKKGYLTRVRVKTADASDDVPEVTYKLWPETIAAIGTPASSDNWFLSSDGTILVTQRIEGDLCRKKDLCALAWKRSDKTTIPLKAFRSIAATLIESHESYGRYVSHFLGHSPIGLKDKHYAAPSQELFDAALKWLRKELFGK